MDDLEFMEDVPLVQAPPTRLRWLILIVFCAANMANAITWLTYSPVALKAGERYNVSINVINWLSMLFMVLYLPGNVMATWALERHGLRFALFTACIAQVVGSALRIGALNERWLGFAFAGQILCGIAQPFFMNAPSKLSAMWFPKEQRSLATSIGAVSNPLGAGIGFLLPSLVLGEYEDIERFMYLHIIEASICLFVLFLVLAFIKPDPSQGNRDYHKKQFNLRMYIKHTMQVVCDKNLFILMISVGIGNGVASAIGTLSDQIYKPINYSSQSIGIFGALFIFFGILGSAIFAVLCDVRKCYSITLISCFVGAGAVHVWWAFSLTANRSIILGFIMSLLGFFLTPTIPLGMDHGAILSPSIGESTISGVLMCAGQIMSLLLILVGGPYIDKDEANTRYFVFGCGGGCFLSAILLFVGWWLRKSNHPHTS